jgi:hypothetical protein
LLFSAGFVAVFCSRLPKISRCSNARVPDSPGGTTAGKPTAAGTPLNKERLGLSYLSENRFSDLRSRTRRSLLKEQKVDALYLSPHVTQDGSPYISSSPTPPSLSSFLRLNLSYLTTSFSRFISFSSPLFPSDIVPWAVGSSRHLLLPFGINSHCYSRRHRRRSFGRSLKSVCVIANQHQALPPPTTTDQTLTAALLQRIRRLSLTLIPSRQSLIPISTAFIQIRRTCCQLSQSRRLVGGKKSHGLCH